MKLAVKTLELAVHSFVHVVQAALHPLGDGCVLLRLRLCSRAAAVLHGRRYEFAHSRLATAATRHGLWAAEGGLEQLSQDSWRRRRVQSRWRERWQQRLRDGLGGATASIRVQRLVARRVREPRERRSRRKWERIAGCAGEGCGRRSWLFSPRVGREGCGEGRRRHGGGARAVVKKERSTSSEQPVGGKETECDGSVQSEGSSA